MILRYMIQFRRLQILGKIEILQSLNPLLLVLQKMNSDRLRPELMRTDRRPVRKIIHRPLHAVPVHPSPAPPEPISENSVFRPLQMVPRNLRNLNPLHNIPRNQESHSRHVPIKRIHTPARNHIPVIQILPRQRFQRLHQFVQP